MTRHVAALAAALVFAAAASAQQVEIRWHGQSFFELKSSKGTRVVFDPHIIEAYGRKMVEADLVLISHLHNDHTQLSAIQGKVRPKVHFGLKAVGKKWDWNPIEETFRDVKIRSAGVYHDSSQGMERGKNLVFILEVDGLRVVHLGDLGHILTDAQLKQIGAVDVLMIPVGGVYTLNGSEAKRVVAQLRPTRFILPMHYGTKVYDDVLPIDEFRDEQKNVKEYVGNLLTVDAAAKPPAEPIIAILGWK